MSKKIQYRTSSMTNKFNIQTSSISKQVSSCPIQYLFQHHTKSTVKPSSERFCMILRTKSTVIPFTRAILYDPSYKINNQTLHQSVFVRFIVQNQQSYPSPERFCTIHRTKQLKRSSRERKQEENFPALRSYQNGKTNQNRKMQLPIKSQTLKIHEDT
jgi:hypothetical protein